MNKEEVVLSKCTIRDRELKNSRFRLIFCFIQRNSLKSIKTINYLVLIVSSKLPLK